MPLLRECAATSRFLSSSESSATLVRALPTRQAGRLLVPSRSPSGPADPPCARMVPQPVEAEGHPDELAILPFSVAGPWDPGPGQEGRGRLSRSTTSHRVLRPAPY